MLVPPTPAARIIDILSWRESVWNCADKYAPAIDPLILSLMTSDDPILKPAPSPSLVAALRSSAISLAPDKSPSLAFSIARLVLSIVSELIC